MKRRSESFSFANVTPRKKTNHPKDQKGKKKTKTHLCLKINFFHERVGGPGGMGEVAQFRGSFAVLKCTQKKYNF